MRPERLYLTDIVEAADAIGRFLKEIGESDFMQDELRQSAVLQKLIVIGEAAARIPKSFTQKHPHVPWRDIAAFRNIAVREYFSVDWPMVWATAMLDLPLLQTQIADLLK